MTTKPGLHPRNRHQNRYDFNALQQDCPELTAFVRQSPAGEATIDFADPAAVKTLNKSVTGTSLSGEKLGYSRRLFMSAGTGARRLCAFIWRICWRRTITTWCRATQRCWISAVGANCIYPLIGHHEYGWRFTGSEVNDEALKSANAIILANPGLNKAIRLRRQKTPDAILNGIIHKNEYYDAVMCNPPFHDSQASAAASSERKRRNLGLKESAQLNFWRPAAGVVVRRRRGGVYYHADLRKAKPLPVR
ncbi:SAM-dependent methyltransferase [Atlantibacter hermannii]|nr:SAM-dependent methyltransferase [Atlantibacter hermannii]